MINRMLSLCRVENTDLMLTQDHGNKIYVYISHKQKKKKFQTNTPELAQATGNVTVANALAVNADWRASLRKKEERALHTILS